ncbi:hypothetical protein J0H58_04360 [bacterium]|nr:hypothetical protein [bacterium]
MVLHKPRWLAAALLAAAAVFASPGVSAAGTVILVEETGGGSFSQSYTLATLPPSFNTPSFNNVQITINTSSGDGVRADHAISTGLNAQAGAGFTAGAGLKITVTDDGFQNANPGSPGFFVGNISNTAAFANTSNEGTATLTGNGTTILGPVTANASPVTIGSGQFLASTPNVSSIPDTFSVQQVLNFRVESITASSASFTAGISTSVVTSTAAVPAPPAALLALAAFPVLGLRRALKRKA